MKKRMTSHQVSHRTFPAVILAAGRGRRLQTSLGRSPKPLARLLGLTLLERAVLSCWKAGVTECYVVVGYGKEKIIPCIEKLGRRSRISVRMVENPNWREGNGTSALAASPYLTGPFLLIMCDHVFDPAILRSLMEAEDGSEGCLLVVDRRTDQVFDLEDATKVRLDGQVITAIGKEITSFDAVDTGLFLCRPLLFDALEKARANGDGSLSGGIRQLIAVSKIKAVDIGDRFWIDIDTRECLAHARRMLLANLAKPHEDGFISRHLNRPLSRRISGRLARTPLIPNAITVLSFLICLCGAFLFSLGGYLWTLIAGLLAQLASVIDGCDGEIARLKFQSSRFGAWLDTVLDRYGDAAIAVGISYGYWLTHPEPIAWLGGILAVTGFILISYTTKEYRLRYGHRLPDNALYKLTPASRDVRLFLVFVGALLNHPFESLILAGLLSHLAVGLRYLTVYSQTRHEPWRKG